MKKISTILVLIVLMSAICIIGYAADIDWAGHKDFLVLSHLVYSPSYSDSFKPTKSGTAKIDNDSGQIHHIGTLKTGVKFCNTDGTVASCPYSETKVIDDISGTADWIYYPNLSASASYKAFLEPMNGLHLFMNRSTVWYQ